MDDTTLSVRERIQVALAHLSSERTQPSIALVCRLAAVSRANLYISHPDILENIRSLSVRKNALNSTLLPKHVVSNVNGRDQKAMVDSLAYTCLELRLAWTSNEQEALALAKKLRH